MSYVLVATKSVPRPTDDATDDPLAPESEEAVAGPPEDDGRRWAGDEYTEGDESDPAQAKYWFTGEVGEAWLDRAEDGTLTGWVREPDGTVFRYADVDAWAIDVDGAGIQTPGAGGSAPEEDTDGGEESPDGQADDDVDDEDEDEDQHPAFGL